MKLHYETYFGVYDHRKFMAKHKRTPVAMARHEGNSLPKEDKLLGLIHDFEETKSVHGMTLLEYMSLPRTVCNDLTRQIKTFLNQKEAAVAAAALRAAKEAQEASKKFDSIAKP